MNQLVSLLEAAINGPNEASQRSVETALNALIEKLKTAPSNSLSPGLRTVLDDLQIGTKTPAGQLVGIGLMNALQEALAEGYTSDQSLDRLRQLVKDVKALSVAIDQLISAFKSLDIEDEELRPGESVLGMAMPRDLVDNLPEFQREIHFFGRLVRDLSECLEGRHEDVKVHSVYSTDIGIDLFSTLQVASQFAGIVAALSTVLEKLRRYRKVKAEVEELGLDKELVESIEEKAVGAVEETIDEIEAEVFSKCKVSDTGRVNELKTSVRIRLKGVAARLERGFTFEARTGEVEDGAGDETVKALVENVKAFTTVRFTPIEGSSILQLTDGDEDSEDEKDTEREVKPPRAKKKRLVSKA